MLYSSCKNEFLNFIKSNYSLVEVSKTFEISEANEITEDFLIEELHPKQAVSAKKFDKPKLATKGPRRITRGNDD
jgi:hypothetical protein